MTITVITSEGRRIEAVDALDAVRALNAAALAGEPDAWRYMLRVAERLRRVTGRQVRTDSPSRFLADLAAAGWIEIEAASLDPLDASERRTRAEASGEAPAETERLRCPS